MSDEQLDDALRDILDVATGWTRRMTEAEKLGAIESIARAALARADVKHGPGDQLEGA